MDVITQFILLHKQDFMEELGLLNEQEVNSGSCVDFAEFVEYELNQEGYESLIRVCNDCLIDYEEDDPMNCTNIHHFYLPSLAEYQITEEQFLHYKQQLQNQNTHKVGYHMWLYSSETNKHYDIEAAEGVNNVFDLPFFKRQLTRFYAIE